jgi:hypothetical protein
MTVQFWILTGVVYIIMVFATGYWHYLIPTHWSIIPDSIRAVGTYLHFQLPDPIPGEPYEPAQKLSYFLVIFVLAPVQIATRAAMSPAVLARFPRYGRLFGGKQGARSLHFLGLCAFAAFTALHTFMVIIHGVPKEFTKIVLGDEDGSRALALSVGMAGIFGIVLFHVIISWFSLRYRRTTQRLLGVVVDPFEKALSRTVTSRQAYRRADISPYHRINGYPPTGQEYQRMAADGFADYRLAVGDWSIGRWAVAAAAARAGSMQPDRQAQLHPGLDRDRRVGRGPVERGAGLGRSPPAGALCLVLRDGRQRSDRGGRPLRVFLRIDGTAPGHQSTDDPGAGDERCAAAHRARRPGPAADRDPTRFQNGQVDQSDRVGHRPR